MSPFRQLRKCVCVFERKMRRYTKSHWCTCVFVSNRRVMMKMLKMMMVVKLAGWRRIFGISGCITHTTVFLWGSHIDSHYKRGVCSLFSHFCFTSEFAMTLFKKNSLFAWWLNAVFENATDICCLTCLDSETGIKQRWLSPGERVKKGLFSSRTFGLIDKETISISTAARVQSSGVHFSTNVRYTQQAFFSSFLVVTRCFFTLSLCTTEHKESRRLIQTLCLCNYFYPHRYYRGTEREREREGTQGGKIEHNIYSFIFSTFW